MATEEAEEPEYTRESVLHACFKFIDADESGILDIPEFRAVLVSNTPTQNLNAAQAFMAALDENEDGMVDFDEFLGAATTPALAELSDPEFIELFKTLMSPMAPAYVHPTGNRAYLEEELVPILREGLEELLKVVESNRLDIAAGRLWDEDGTLPEEWLPFESLRWLGKWLLEPAKRIDEKKMPKFGPKMFNEMSLGEQLEVVFRHVDKDDNGVLTFDEIFGLCTFLNPVTTESDAQEFLSSMDHDEDGVLDEKEFVANMIKMMEAWNQSKDDLSFHCMRILGAKHLRTFSRRDKLKLCFAHIDIDKSGELSTEELVRVSSALTSDEAVIALQEADEALENAQTVYDEAVAAAPDAKRTAKKLKKLELAKKDQAKAALALERAKGAETQVATAFGRIDADGSGMISSEEFCDTFLALTQDLNEDMFDLGVARLLGKNPIDDDNDPMIEMDPAFAEYVRAFQLHKVVKHVSPAKLSSLAEDEDVQLVLVDARSKSEQSVASIPNAQKVQINLSDMDVIIAAGVEGLGAAVQNSADLKEAVSIVKDAIFRLGDEGKQVVVVCYDSCGLRGSLLAYILSEHSSVAESEETAGNYANMQAFNLCGGILEYYNRGFMVVNVDDKPVEMVHPGAHRAEQYVTRPNDFKLPKRRQRRSRNSTRSGGTGSRPNTQGTGLGVTPRNV